MGRRLYVVPLLVLCAAALTARAGEGPLYVTCTYAGQVLTIPCYFSGDQEPRYQWIDVRDKATVEVDGTAPFYVQHGWGPGNLEEAVCLSALDQPGLAAYCCAHARFELRINGQPVLPDYIVAYYGTRFRRPEVAEPIWILEWGFLFEAGELPAGVYLFEGHWDWVGDGQPECWPMSPESALSVSGVRRTTVTVLYPQED